MFLPPCNGIECLIPQTPMREAIALYPRMFEDVTWQADTAAAE